jgi:hypothetical protein
MKGDHTMTRYAKTELVLNREFDAQSCRHRIDGNTTVLHCHHYATLYTQLAMDCGMLDATALLAECAEDAWEKFLRDYYQAQGITGLADRITLAEQTYAAAGLGKMRITCAGPESGEVTLEHSHVDEGWLKKWGAHDKPVNYIGAGFIAGAFAAIFDRPTRSFMAIETVGIVTGAPRSHFTVVAR